MTNKKTAEHILKWHGIPGLSSRPHKDVQKDYYINKTKIAIEKTIPCLEDWIRTTSFGEVNRRDREALNSLIEALELLKKIR